MAREHLVSVDLEPTVTLELRLRRPSGKLKLLSRVQVLTRRRRRHQLPCLLVIQPHWQVPVQKVRLASPRQEQTPAVQPPRPPSQTRTGPNLRVGVQLLQRVMHGWLTLLVTVKRWRYSPSTWKTCKPSQHASCGTVTARLINKAPHRLQAQLLRLPLQSQLQLQLQLPWAALAPLRAAQ